MYVTDAMRDFTNDLKEIEMSMMCKMNGSCEAAEGMCIHEKMMLGMVVLAAAGGAAFWFFG
jgi:hypothetical protein